MPLNNSGFLQDCSAWACCNVCKCWHAIHRPGSHAGFLQVICFNLQEPSMATPLQWASQPNFSGR